MGGRERGRELGRGRGRARGRGGGGASRARPAGPHAHPASRPSKPRACVSFLRRLACMNDSMARSFATATVSPRGSKLAWATHEAIMADLASPWAAVTTYRPPDTRASALATSGGMAALSLAMVSFWVRAWARSVPVYSRGRKMGAGCGVGYVEGHAVPHPRHTALHTRTPNPLSPSRHTPTHPTTPAPLSSPPRTVGTCPRPGRP